MTFWEKCLQLRTNNHVLQIAVIDGKLKSLHIKCVLMNPLCDTSQPQHESQLMRMYPDLAYTNVPRARSSVQIGDS